MPIPVPALNPSPMTGVGNNTWLIDGREPTLIDAGVGVPAHIDAIARALGGRELRRVLVTHGHADHSSGIPALRSRWPDVEVCVSEFHADARSFNSLRDRDVVTAGDARLEVLYTPGHAIDHICFWDASSRDLYAGDMVVKGSTVMIPAAAGGGLAAYLASLERLAALEPARVYPGHGPVIDDPLDVIAEYIAHRRMRDEQVAACLRDGVTDPDAIVARIYPDLAPALHFAARATVEAHLVHIGLSQKSEVKSQK
jgi:glyoxylase-like metal-dependent hydrolase (beta-lactamase superfamily II)